jgi:cytochrome c oxidase cbb3-type subunit 2
MPSFTYLFEVKPKAESGDRVVAVPPKFAPTEGVVVAKPAALDLVSYLLSLDHTYPLVVTNNTSR